MADSELDSVRSVGNSLRLTYHDRPDHVQIYDALVLYAVEDESFVDELLCRMKDQGFQMCTRDDLEAGHTTEYAPVAHLISERCRRIILVFSPEFLNSPDMMFYMDYTQAISIKSRQSKILPIMYRTCKIPQHMSFYLPLYYEAHGLMYDFWFKLKQTLEFAQIADNAEQPA